MFFEEPVPADARQARRQAFKTRRDGFPKAKASRSRLIFSPDRPIHPAGIGRANPSAWSSHEAIMSTMFGSGKKKARVSFFVARDVLLEAEKDFTLHCIALLPEGRLCLFCEPEARFVLVLRCGMQFIHIIMTALEQNDFTSLHLAVAC